MCHCLILLTAQASSKLFTSAQTETQESGTQEIGITSCVFFYYDLVFTTQRRRRTLISDHEIEANFQVNFLIQISRSKQNGDGMMR